MFVTANKQLKVLTLYSAFCLGFTKERFKKTVFSFQMCPWAK